MTSQLKLRVQRLYNDNVQTLVIKYVTTGGEGPKSCDVIYGQINSTFKDFFLFRILLESSKWNSKVL
jgi:hypothetical protein